MTQLEYAKKNKITPLVKRIAQQEGVDARGLLKNIKAGRVVVLKNNRHNLKKPCAVGYGLRTKVNANIGTSTDKSGIKDELRKLTTAIKYGADAVMDLSVGGNLKTMRLEALKKSTIPLGTVPVYELAVNAQRKNKNFLSFTDSDMLDILDAQGREGVDFFTLHAGVTKKSMVSLRNSKRILNIVSRGGAIIANWMNLYGKENPFFEHFDEILDIAYKYDVVLSLGDGMRPGSILDANDEAQFSELKILGGLALRAKKRNVQVMIEGPGHVPLDKIKENIILEKKLCHNAPFYVLGPLVTDIASGYDHINASIGGALAASFGADFLCYVTPAEHLRHPSLEDVRDGVVASKISAHSADIVKRNKQAIEWDRQMSLARKKRDWVRQIRLSIDPDKAGEYRKSSQPTDSGVCTMCGKYCSIKLMEECLRV
ncbi:MAG: phosphomethylpyrimidine synthase [Candidatus Omnitrophica bacterium CG08_land_8_20_14_0_20_41_16]|uniref:Phosphomethylpyrimidine synthase n=1 Tax=Candidatus Sherwoodlollariibacterium unditelluris TaxID=1974757 RepID=A0A2G9YKS6_9BACT|nr:MAG: phosphomethylpyrimidine synthase [Candidatus Omnitrophica bacterium CG23_combo_of_CG06-09_8_20_14_all_41_10]PIS33619.1 MAG: phosphomethylpyrimidine synthase [Candidatus Omnitrophica bacterium CG08_land_8_20_14_0_20_41_16]